MSRTPPTPITLVVGALPAHWRERAAEFRRWGAEEQARCHDLLAGELEAALRERATESLTLDEASAESGYSVDHLRHLVSEGTIPNAGRKHAPRIRRSDLPARPGARPKRSAYDPQADARDILRRA